MIATVVHRGELPATATYVSRVWAWCPGVEAAPGWERYIGDLTITLTRGSGREEEDLYAVEELEPLPGLMGRVFRLTNRTDPDSVDPYRVQVGGLPACTCRAASHGRPCKHIPALAAVVRAALLDESEEVIPGVPQE